MRKAWQTTPSLRYQMMRKVHPHVDTRCIRQMILLAAAPSLLEGGSSFLETRARKKSRAEPTREAAQEIRDRAPGSSREAEAKREAAQEVYRPQPLKIQGVTGETGDYVIRADSLCQVTCAHIVLQALTSGICKSCQCLASTCTDRRLSRPN